MDSSDSKIPGQHSLRSPRFSVPTRATVETAESQKVEGRLVNLSVHGALTRLVERLPINSPVIVCFDLAVDGKVQRLRIPGTIVHNDSRGTAIEFGSVPEKTNDLLRHFSVYQLVGNR